MTSASLPFPDGDHRDVDDADDPRVDRRRKPVQALGQGFRLAALTLWQMVVTVLLVITSCLDGLGVTTNAAARARALVRLDADAERALAWQDADLAAETSYTCPTRLRRVRRDPGHRRDVLWHWLSPVSGLVIFCVPMILLGYLLLGVGHVGRVLWDDLTGVSEGWGPSFLDYVGYLVVGLLLLTAAALPMPWLVRARHRLALWVLTPSSKEVLTHRVRTLESTRKVAVDSRADEIARIERDLHDGAQARLVAMGMTLSAADHLVAENPQQARRLIREARDESAITLAEIRSIVRGIAPPVLADRGLVDAVRALAAVHPLDVTVETDPGIHRMDAALETALYFCVVELVTNAAKHSGAASVSVRFTSALGRIGVLVTDDGVGGLVLPDADGPSGLSGIQRRIAPFDGVIDVDSPRGGPTVVSVVVP